MTMPRAGSLVRNCCIAAIILAALAPAPSEAAPRRPVGTKDRTIKTNLYGYFYMARAAAAVMPPDKARSA
mgnify:CR=1 FL=1